MAEPMKPPAKASMKNSPESLATIGRLAGDRSRSPAGALGPTRGGSCA